MTEWSPDFEQLRLAVFMAALSLFSLIESIWPLRQRQEPALRHRLRNLAVSVTGTVVVRAVVPMLPVLVAAHVHAQGLGLFGTIALPSVIELVCTVVVLDLLIYVQHVVFHKVPFLWWLHRIHHSDREFDASTGVRFHPLEILLSIGIKLAAVRLLGAPAFGVFLFEVILSSTALFNHANFNLPRPVDRALRWVLVTPAMHRVHHSSEPDETDSNFGFNLPWWDRLFGTYRSQARLGDDLDIGLKDFPQPLGLGRLLIQPFMRPPGADRDHAGQG